MFGLMRPQQSCSQKNTNDYRHHRMHYCGTCKTIGQAYGQRARAMLNFDTVFFAEILSLLSKENLAGWQEGYQAINRCFTMPDQEQAAPLSLQFAAATNILLGELKLDDHIKDLPGIKWKLARHFFSKPFRKANRQMQEWGMDTQLLWHWVRQQDKLEKTTKTNFTSLHTLLNHYAEPTAQMTGLIFKKGAAVVGQSGHEMDLFDLGYQFGRLAYFLDAFEDVEKDLNRRQFNPLAQFFGGEKTLREDQFVQARQLVLACQEAVTQQLKKLPFTDQVIERYTVRLYSNLAPRLYRERNVPKSLQEQMGGLWETVAKKTAQAMFRTTAWARSANYYMVSLVVFLIPLAADYVGFSDKEAVYKHAAIFTAILAAIGLGRHALARRKKRKAKRKGRKGRKGKGKIRRFFQRLPLLFVNKRPCAEECAASCGDACCQACCDTCCEELCNSICEEGLCNGEGGQRAVVVVTVLLLILIVVAMILILV